MNAGSLYVVHALRHGGKYSGPNLPIVLSIWQDAAELVQGQKVLICSGCCSEGPTAVEDSVADVLIVLQAAAVKFSMPGKHWASVAEATCPSSNLPGLGSARLIAVLPMLSDRRVLKACSARAVRQDSPVTAPEGVADCLSLAAAASRAQGLPLSCSNELLLPYGLCCTGLVDRLAQSQGHLKLLILDVGC